MSSMGGQGDAIRHALEAFDFERAAGLIELAIPPMRQSRQEATAFGWLKALPNELLRARPVLSVYYAGALLLNGKLEGVEDHCGTPNSGWTRRQTWVQALRSPHHLRWSSWMKRNFAV